MLASQKQIVGMVKRREQDIEIMQLLLKHNLARKRAEYRVLITYYKVCNTVSKAKLMILGVDRDNIGAHHTPQVRNDIKRASLWDEHFERQASNS